MEVSMLSCKTVSCKNIVNHSCLFHMCNTDQTSSVQWSLDFHTEGLACLTCVLESIRHEAHTDWGQTPDWWSWSQCVTLSWGAALVRLVPAGWVDLSACVCSIRRQRMYLSASLGQQCQMGRFPVFLAVVPRPSLLSRLQNTNIRQAPSWLR